MNKNDVALQLALKSLDCMKGKSEFEFTTKNGEQSELKVESINDFGLFVANLFNTIHENIKNLQ